MPLDKGKIYNRALRNQRRRASRRGWAPDDPRIERRASRRADQRYDFRQGIQSGAIPRPANRLDRNMAWRDFIGQKYDPAKVTEGYNRRMERRQNRPGGPGGHGGMPGMPGMPAGGKGGKGGRPAPTGPKVHATPDRPGTQVNF